MTREDFARWRDDPVTRFVFRALERQIERQHTAWNDHSWGGGGASKELLSELRTRADTYATIIATDYEGYCAAIGVEPRED